MFIHCFPEQFARLFGAALFHHDLRPQPVGHHRWLAQGVVTLHEVLRLGEVALLNVQRAEIRHRRAVVTVDRERLLEVGPGTRALAVLEIRQSAQEITAGMPGNHPKHGIGIAVRRVQLAQLDMHQSTP